ncbi:MAG: hypothetical protein B6D39_08100 [Anaerolineae bacterium UTCFX2]|jgi:branched-chain amino acid transport system permease protein|nr:branched-chain amino acid ABC transporter ATP-binding protein/permease [Anaerolineales bacterium]OQY90496.1 MAG: hypothetical protein B6D39_08100 [Anaerolineae bacterium UTCFX2]
MKRTNLLPILVIVAFLAVLLALPNLLSNEYYLRLAIMSGLFILLASAHNILMKVGQLSLGPVAFYGLGAYVSAILSVRYHTPFLLAFLAAGVITAAVGWVIGKLTLKLRTAYFVLVTIGFAEFFRLVAINWTDMTNGPMGITAVPAPASWFVGYRPYYYFILLLVVLVLAALYRIEHSTIGRAMHAIRENETLGRSVGIDSYRYMMFAAVLSSFIIGLSGSFYAHFFQFVGPELLSFDLTIAIVIMVIAGGRSTLAGPVIGAILFTIIPELLRAASSYRMVIYGALLVLLMLFMPDGILPAVMTLLRRIIALVSPALQRLATSLTGKPFALPQPVESAPALANAAATMDAPRALTSLTSKDDGGLTAPNKDKLEGQKELIRVEDLSVHFGGIHAVERLSFSVEQGEIFAIIGPNGAGKTTLLNAITRLGPITSGTITFQGETLNSLQAHDVARRRLVRTFQHTSVFPHVTTNRNLVLAHNLREPAGLLPNLLRTRHYRASEVDCRIRAKEVLAFLKLEHHADTQANSLPYGNQRLLELGIAMMTNPSVLLLDEPAAGMNSTEVEMLMDLILSIRDMGVTVILVEHDMKLVMGISERILVLNYGKRIAMGHPDEIRQNEDVITAYLGRRAADATAN